MLPPPNKTWSYPHVLCKVILELEIRDSPSTPQIGRHIVRVVVVVFDKIGPFHRSLSVCYNPCLFQEHPHGPRPTTVKKEIPSIINQQWKLNKAPVGPGIYEYQPPP
jgi:hypothetical protein